MLFLGQANAAFPTGRQPFITLISITDSNLVFSAIFPPDVEHAVLEMRPELDASWQEAALLNVPESGGEVQFSIPKPVLAAAFFRLNITVRSASEAQLSPESRYITMPPLGPDATNAASPAEAVFHFKGMIDGSDRIIITHKGAFWEHVNWGWPAGAVTINGSQWDPREKNFMTTTVAVAFLPEMYSLNAVSLEKIEGRDVVALERTNNALIVYLDDTPVGAAAYEFKIHFHLAATQRAKARISPTATLKIAAQIDGSDLLKITAHEATWMHKAYSSPAAVRLNDMVWDVNRTNVLMNAGTNTFLPSDVDLSTAKIIHRQGRDVGAMWADDKAVWISFADNPLGSDAYELELSFGP